MRIIIEIPKEYESDYKGDMFKDFFSRVLCDIQDGTLCGNYEKETAEMLLKAFDESKPMDRIVEQLETSAFVVVGKTKEEFAEDIRNKAIDDFVEQLKNSLLNNYRHFLTRDTDGFDWLTTDAVNTHIDEVAKQLKEGSADNE